MPIRVEGIGDELNEKQRNALSIMTNLPIERFNKLKENFLKINDSPDLIELDTLVKFLEFSESKQLDLSNEGVIRFKDLRLPVGNQGNLRGVIGKDTANEYYDVLTLSDGLIFSTTYAKGEILSQLTEIEKRGYEALIMEAAEDFNFQPSVIGGIGSRESFWGLILTPKGPTGTGDKGHGRGLLQIDDRSHEFARTGNWKIPRDNMRYGCDLLADNRAVLKSEGLTGRKLLIATLASYNAGLGAVLGALDHAVDVDSVTAGRDYGKDTIDRAGWFQEFAKWS